MSQTLQHILREALGAYKSGQFQRTLELAKKITEIYADHPDSVYLIALSHARLGNVPEAEEAFAKARLHHSNPAEVLHNQAGMYRSAGDFPSAERCYREALEIKPDYVPARLSLAVTLSRQARYKEAIDQYNTVLTQQPENTKALCGLGSTFNRQNNPKQAMVVLKRALARREDDPIALNNISNSSLKLGRLDDYLKYAELAYKAAPQNHDIVANLARAYERLSRHEDAVGVYQRAIQLEPGSCDTHRDFAKLFWTIGRQDLLFVALDRDIDAIRDEKKVGKLLLLKGELANQAGLRDIARAAFEQSSKITESAEAHLGLAKVLKAEKEFGSARRQFEAALLLDSNDAVLRHEFASFLLGRHECDSANEILSWQPPREHLQRHLALLATVDRATGGEQYRKLYNYEKFTTKVFIEHPKRYAGLKEFLKSLSTDISGLFDTTQQPIDQTLYGGVQTKGDLWETDRRTILDLKECLFDAASKFVRGLKYDESHPFLRMVPDFQSTFLQYAGSWAVRLNSGGGHVDHIHPEGWLSSAHYVTVPDTISQASGEDKSGWLRLGAPPIEGLELPAEHYIKPEPGALILFPSYMWHGVEPFESNQPRITTPFDLRSTVG